MDNGASQFAVVVGLILVLRAWAFGPEELLVLCALVLCLLATSRHRAGPE
jgi:hypothetical protein